jgi:hypothetical protein
MGPLDKQDISYIELLRAMYGKVAGEVPGMQR